MLSSIATLIHDTYLPLYLQDVLGLSNTKVGCHSVVFRAADWCCADCRGICLEGRRWQSQVRRGSPCQT